MSYLEEDELKALKKHLGIQDDVQQQEKDIEKKPVVTRRKDTSRPYTIIKRVVNVVDSDNKPDEKESKKPQRRAVESTSGLRPGFVVVQDSSYETLAARAVKKKKKSAETKSEDDLKAAQTISAKTDKAVEEEKPKTAEISKAAAKETVIETIKEAEKASINESEKEVAEVKKESVTDKDKAESKTEEIKTDTKEDTPKVSAASKLPSQN